MNDWHVMSWLDMSNYNIDQVLGLCRMFSAMLDIIHVLPCYGCNKASSYIYLIEPMTNSKRIPYYNM